MTTTYEYDSNPEDNIHPPKLRLHVDRILKERSISEAQVCHMAGIRRAELDRMKSERFFLAIEAVLRVALALDIPMESLFPAELLSDIRDEVRDRRAHLQHGSPGHSA